MGAAGFGGGGGGGKYKDVCIGRREKSVWVGGTSPISESESAVVGWFLKFPGWDFSSILALEIMSRRSLLFRFWLQ